MKTLRTKERSWTRSYTIAIAMLDVFLTLFVVTSFLFLVIDRERLVDGTPDSGDRGSGVLSRPWLLAAGMAAGAGAATKWVGLLAVAGVAALSLLWTITRRG